MASATNQTFPCSACGKTYQRKSHLARHEATHGKARYECHACQKTFSRSDVWRKHCVRCQKQGAPVPPRLTRGPKPGACEQCFRSKVTCDKADPCSRCLSRQLPCNYTRRGARLDATPSHSTDAQWETGTMFLLSLTDPTAANMLESFTDDTPSLVSDDTSSVGLEPVFFQDDDVFLQSLCDFAFDPAYLSTDYEIPAHEGNGHPSIAPIFQPEAIGALQIQSESVIQSLHALHEKLTASDASYSEPFPESSIRHALSTESILRFTATYFHLTHRHIPIIHRPSFGAHDTAETLLLAVILAGALRSPPQDDALVIRSLARLFEEYIFLRLEETMTTYGPSSTPQESKWLLETLQAAIIVNNVQLMVNSVPTRRRVRTRRLPVLVSAVRRLGMLSIRHSPGADSIQYLYEESCIRIAHWTALVDWLQGVMFHLPPLLSVSEMTWDMPRATALWDRANAYETLQQQGDWPAGPLSIRDCVQSLMQEQIQDTQLASLRELSMLNLYLIILGLSSAILSASHMCTISISAPALERGLTRWQEIWKVAVSKMGDTESIVGIERYSDGQWWAARRTLDTLVSGDELPPYLGRVGHETLAEFHSFLLQSQVTGD